ncbi:hypothetical protein D3C86_2169970 [compost metagenome]
MARVVRFENATISRRKPEPGKLDGKILLIDKRRLDAETVAGCDDMIERRFLTTRQGGCDQAASLAVEIDAAA